MTTAVWSYKHMTLGADRQCGGGLDVGKIFPVGENTYLTGAGYYDDIVEVAKWMSEGAKEEKKPDIAGRAEEGKDSDFLLVENGVAYWLTTPFLRKVEVTNEFIALGTGRRYALGALEAGATVEEALAIAAKYDEYTGTECNMTEIKKAPATKKVARARKTKA